VGIEGIVDEDVAAVVDEEGAVTAGVARTPAPIVFVTVATTMATGAPDET
jgi:hypothetical protein